MAFLFKGYLSLLQNYTLPTQMATGGFTSALGDVIYQQGFEKRGWRDHELYRTRRLFTYGGLIFAPIANRWHFLLSKINVGGKWSTIVARTVTDGAIFAPFATCLFYASQGTMEGRPWRSTAEIQGINERLRERLWGTVQKQWCVFGPAQVINLTLIPLYARPPFMNMFACGWSVFLAGAQNVGRIPPQGVDALGSRVKGVGSESIGVVAAEVME